MTMMMKPLPIIFTFLLIFLSACSSPYKTLDQGDFDQALEQTLRRLEGRRNIKRDQVLLVEEAFNKATERDMAMAGRLKREGRPENWPRIFENYQRIQDRQDRLTPFLPLVSKDGYKANFKFVKVEELKFEAKEEAAEYFYTSAGELLQRARSGDRFAAREAYDLLSEIDVYYQDYKNMIDMKQEALELGTTYVIVEVENRAPVAMPALLEQELLALDEGDLNARWKQFHTRRSPGMEYDYQALVQLVDLAVSPANTTQREYQLRTTVEDGFEYVLDERGNVKKDSSGNDIKVPREVEVVATVFESYQTKAATITGQLQLTDLRTGTLVDRNEITAESIFENYASTFQGDERALDEEAKRRIGNRPLPFPTDEALLVEAGRQLKNRIESRIRNNRRLE